MINTSYERSRNSSIILFRRARCEFVASNAAIEGFLRPEVFEPNSRLRCRPGTFLLAILRWVLLATFFVTIGTSSLYLIQRVIEAIRERNILASIASLILCVIMAFNVWSALVFIFGLATTFCGECGARIRHFLYSVNQCFVNRMAAQIFAIDVHNTDGGELVDVPGQGGYEGEILDRIDRLEKKLEKALASNAEEELEVEEIAGEK